MARIQTKSDTKKNQTNKREQTPRNSEMTTTNNACELFFFLHAFDGDITRTISVIDFIHYYTSTYFSFLCAYFGPFFAYGLMRL
jgi:hypothetical protein